MVNLDPAADSLPYEPDIDVRELIRVEDAMRGNLGMVPMRFNICMEYLAMHLEWLEDKISEFGEDDTLLFDCPGQIELYTHLWAMPQLVRALQESCHVKLCATFLVDAVSIDQPAGIRRRRFGGAVGDAAAARAARYGLIEERRVGGRGEARSISGRG